MRTIVVVPHTLFVMLSRGDFGAIMHIDIHPPLYVTSTTYLVIVCIAQLVPDLRDQY
jgi:hypothetical protein